MGPLFGWICSRLRSRGAVVSPCNFLVRCVLVQPLAVPCGVRAFHVTYACFISKDDTLQCGTLGAAASLLACMGRMAVLH